MFLQSFNNKLGWLCARIFGTSVHSPAFCTPEVEFAHDLAHRLAQYLFAKVAVALSLTTAELKLLFTLLPENYTITISVMCQVALFSQSDNPVRLAHILSSRSPKIL